ncbi:MAG: TonB-dependent receptor [Pseudomonadota bacterium]|nr:TonB-dependent receptor [Pseudomonadota bacterium]
MASQSDEIIVYGRGEKRIGTAVSASEGAVAGADLLVRPLSRTGELVEAVPGLLAVQHSGGGKANQYYLRGYNLDHGTDFTFALDGVPLNFRSHGHGQGYLDLNGLIPETIARIDYRKGPYRADVGDFALIAYAAAKTVDHFDAPFLAVEAGSFGFRRLTGGASFALGAGTLLVAADGKTVDGPWELAEKLRHISLFGKYSRMTPLGMLRVSLSAYQAKWRPTEQIPVRAIGNQIADRFGTLDPFLKGETNRQILTVQLESATTSAAAYAQHYGFDLISNYTFFLDDPVNGDELGESDKRRVYGAKVERRFAPVERLEVMVGAEGRIDDIGAVGLFQTRFGERIATRSLYAITESSVAIFAEATWKPSDRISLFAGLRGDRFAFRTRARGGDAVNGSVDDAILSPKFGASIILADGVALYGNYGRGYHSNDARRVVEAVDPALPLARGTGKEVGVRLERGDMIATANYWWVDSQSELLLSTDIGTVQPAGASRRRGYEATIFYRPADWLAIDAVWAKSRARFRDAPGFDHIPGALDSAAELGMSAVFSRWNGAVRVRYLGPHALAEDNSVRGPSTTLVNLRAAWIPGRIELFGELLNVLDSKKADSDFFYASRLPGEPIEGVAGVHSRTVEPRQLRVGAKARF